MSILSSAELARHIDLTLVAPEATRADLERLCTQARELRVHGVCVNGSRVEFAYTLLQDSEIKVTAMIGFPYGAADSDAKRYETEVAADHGAHEIETVLNVGRLKDGDDRYVLRELRDLAEAADERPVKVILQTALLTLDEQRKACELALDAGVHFVCTGTGIGWNASVDEVKALRERVGPKFGLKASALHIDPDLAEALIKAGATRLGTYWRSLPG